MKVQVQPKQLAASLRVKSPSNVHVDGSSLPSLPFHVYRLKDRNGDRLQGGCTCAQNNSFSFRASSSSADLLGLRPPAQGEKIGLESSQTAPRCSSRWYLNLVLCGAHTALRDFSLSDLQHKSTVYYKEEGRRVKSFHIT